MAAPPGRPDPARYYDMPTYLAALGPVVGAGYPGQLWSYPPVALLIAAPFGLLPYLPALSLWTACGIVGFTVALRLWTRDWRIIALLLAAPAALIGLMSGQFALLAAAILLAVLRWARKPPLAGRRAGRPAAGKAPACPVDPLAVRRDRQLARLCRRHPVQRHAGGRRRADLGASTSGTSISPPASPTSRWCSVIPIISPGRSCPPCS